MVSVDDKVILQNVAHKLGQIISEDVPGIEEDSLRELLGSVITNAEQIVSSIVQTLPENNEQNEENGV